MTLQAQKPLANMALLDHETCNKLPLLPFPTIPQGFCRPVQASAIMQTGSAAQVGAHAIATGLPPSNITLLRYTRVHMPHMHSKTRTQKQHIHIHMGFVHTAIM